MKYVLVIDVPEPLESEDVKVDYLCYYHCGNIIENKIDVFPKPLPQMKWIDKTLEFGGYENIIQESLARGYNACLEEIQNDN